MNVKQECLSPEETARLGNEIYERIRSRVEAGNVGKVVAIDTATEKYAVGENVLEAVRSLQVQRPEGEIWLIRVGHRSLHRILSFSN